MMADETYRRFHSGRFGPEGEVNIPYDTQIAGTKGVTSNTPKKEEKEKEKDKDEEGPNSTPPSDDDEEGFGSSWFSGWGS